MLAILYLIGSSGYHGRGTLALALLLVQSHDVSLPGTLQKFLWLVLREDIKELEKNQRKETKTIKGWCHSSTSDKWKGLNLTVECV